MESRKAVGRDQAGQWCCEHLTLIDVLLGGQEAAADFLRQHLRNAAHEKLGRIERNWDYSPRSGRT